MDDAWQVVVVHRDRTAREGLAALLSRLGHPTTALASQRDLLLLRPEDLGLVVMDLESGSLELCHELATNSPGTPVILISGTRVLAADRVAGLLAGADDYLTEPVDADELLARARRSIRRRSVLPEAEQANGRVPDRPILSSREREVLEFLAQGLTDRQIAQRLVISPKTVSTHIQHVLAKLQVHSRAQAVSRALRPDDGPVSTRGT